MTKRAYSTKQNLKGVILILICISSFLSAFPSSAAKFNVLSRNRSEIKLTSSYRSRGYVSKQTVKQCIVIGSHSLFKVLNQYIEHMGFGESNVGVLCYVSGYSFREVYYAKPLLPVL